MIVSARPSTGVSIRPRKRKSATAQRMHPEAAISRYVEVVTTLLQGMRDRLETRLTRHDSPADDDALDKLRAAGLLGADERLTPDQIDALRDLISAVGEDTSASSAEAVQAVTGISVDEIRLEAWGDSARPAVSAWAEENVQRIVTVADEFKQRMADEIAESFNNGERAEDLAERLASAYDLSEYEATRIAVTETLQLNSDLNTERMTDLGCETFIWRCADPCPICEEFDGEEYSFSDEPAQGMPGYVHPFASALLIQSYPRIWSN